VKGVQLMPVGTREAFLGSTRQSAAVVGAIRFFW
jgi:hypothetical protein